MTPHPEAQPPAADGPLSAGQRVAVAPTEEERGLPAKEFVGRSPGQLAWARLRRNRTAMVSGLIVLGFIVAAIAAPLIERIYGVGPGEFNGQLLNRDGLPLGYSGGITFGTDNPSGKWHILGVQPGTGRDLFILLVYGARTSLGIAFTVVLVAATIGTLFGLAAAYFGGWVDTAVSWLIDFMLAFPFLLFAIAVMPVVNSLLADEQGFVTPGQRVATVIGVLAAFTWMTSARLVRGQVLSLREREYVDAARAAGAGVGHLMFRQILPNLWAPILVVVSLAVPAIVTAEAALSFLGIGVVEPTPDWGRMVAHSVPWLQAVPTYTLISGAPLVILVLSFNLFGDGLRDALDPKSTS